MEGIKAIMINSNNVNIFLSLRRIKDKNIIHFICKKLVKFFTNKMVKKPPRVKENQIVFLSSEDYSDNALALYEYLIENHYNDKYHIFWLVENPKLYREHKEKNVKFIKMIHKKLKIYTYTAHKVVITSKYIFYTHSLNWSKRIRMNQLYIDLWHGCGYKGQKIGNNRKIFFDYCLVPGEEFIKIKSDFFSCTKKKILPIGYPRYDWFKTQKSNAVKFVNDLKNSKNVKKIIIWMPTFRESKSKRLNDATIDYGLKIPLFNNEKELMDLDNICSKYKVLIILKKHFLQTDYKINNLEFENIIYIDNNFLNKKNINLYELLSKTDALISDYSSVAIDYLLLNKPIGYILDDYDEYSYNREWSFKCPKKYMPGEHIYNIDDLKKFIVDVNDNRDFFYKDRERIKNKLHRPCECYSKRIVDYFNL